MARKEMADEFVENVNDLKERIADLEKSYKNTVKDKIVEGKERFEAKVHESPIQTMGMAFGTGLVIGALGAALIKMK
jgi:ElaB/YqjD/DUF883 family membrane-anchored ribosome-binding protein